MNKDLLRKLIETSIIKPFVEIEAHYTVVEFSGNSTIRKTGEFVIFEIVENAGHFDFVCASAVDGRRRVIPEEDIILIDGMEPERFANVFGIAPDGSKLKMGKRRGRKPKHLIEMEEDDEDVLA